MTRFLFFPHHQPQLHHSLRFSTQLRRAELRFSCFMIVLTPCLLCNRYAFDVLIAFAAWQGAYGVAESEIHTLRDIYLHTGIAPRFLSRVVCAPRALAAAAPALPPRASRLAARRRDRRDRGLAAGEPLPDGATARARRAQFPIHFFHQQKTSGSSVRQAWAIGVLLY